MPKLATRSLVSLGGLLLLAASKHGFADEFDLVQPLHLNVFGIYSDGGTVPFEIVDARGVSVVGCFDGRMQVIGHDQVMDVHPTHVFVGARHPTEPNARPLPLWGEEERALLGLLSDALRNDLSAEERDHLSEVNYPIDWNDQRRASLGFVLRCVEGRMRRLRCIDEGLPACADCLRSQNSYSIPITVETITMDDSISSYLGRARDAQGKTFEFVMPADTTGPNVPASQIRDQFNFTYPLGSEGDRCLLTALALAKTETEIKLHPSLLQVVRARIRYTFSTDTGR